MTKVNMKWMIRDFLKPRSMNDVSISCIQYETMYFFPTIQRSHRFKTNISFHAHDNCISSWFKTKRISAMIHKH